MEHEALTQAIVGCAMDVINKTTGRRHHFFCILSILFIHV